MRFLVFVAAGLLMGLGASGSAAAQDGRIELSLPIDCTPGANCWVANYVDLDPGKGAQDFMCGPRSYDTHKGTDFAIRDMAVLLRGVQVLAAADGTVTGVRHGQPDVNFRRRKPEDLKGKECGNGVVIQHENGWTTQYCHLRERSIQVNSSDIVKAGQPLGLVGLSGRTEFPHLHIVVRKNGKVIDPFVGESRSGSCGRGEKPLWSKDVMALLRYEPAALYNSGISQVRPSSESVRSGLLRDVVLSSRITVLYPWVDIFGPRKGDILTMSLVAPNGKQIWKRDLTFQKSFARSLRARRVNIKGSRIPPGDYKAEFLLTRKGSGGEVTVRTASRVSIK